MWKEKWNIETKLNRSNMNVKVEESSELISEKRTVAVIVQIIGDS